MRSRPARSLLIACALGAAASPAIGAETASKLPKNYIIFIADGAGESTHRALEYWQGAPPIYTGEDWARHTVTTYALRSNIRPSGRNRPLDQEPRLQFRGEVAYNAMPTQMRLDKYPVYFHAYRWLRQTAPDSANTATAIFTGTSTYKGAVNMDGAVSPVTSVGEIAAQKGLAVGVVSSVAFSHATPACAAGTHVPQREMYHDITHQMLTSGVCTVIAGAGHPEFDDSGKQRDANDYKWISEADLEALRAGEINAPDKPAWTFVEDTSAIKALAQGDTPEQLFILPKVAQTLQQKRAPWTFADASAPGEHDPIADLPTLVDLTLAGLNAVDDDPDGFVLVVEGGAVDWAMHDNQIGRMIEEMADFHASISAVSEILDAGDRGFDWSDTLVLVTADHDHLLLGPNSGEVAFEPLEDRGQGEIPGHIWHSDGHSNLPVPLYARGCLAQAFDEIPTDPHNGPQGMIHVFHQREIGRLLLKLLAEQD